MEKLKQPIKTAFLEALSDFRPGTRLEDVEVLAYLHAVEDRGRAKSFAIQTSAQIATFLSARGVFEIVNGARVITEYRADGVPQPAADQNSDG